MKLVPVPFFPEFEESGGYFFDDVFIFRCHSSLFTLFSFLVKEKLALAMATIALFVWNTS